MKVFSIKYLFLANDCMTLDDDLDKLPVEQPVELVNPYTCKGCSEPFETVQKLATHSRYCPDDKALREGQQKPTGIN